MSQKVIFIAGAGRSGSTLLSRVLATADDIETIGEAGTIHWFRDPGSLVCGCGKRLDECEIWNEIVENSYGDWDTFEQCEGQRRFVRTRDLIWLVSPLRAWFLCQPRLREARSRFTKFYSAISDTFDAEILVDSTKHPAAGKILEELDQVDLRCLHLVRDPVDVAASWMFQKADPGSSAGRLSRKSPLYSALSWVVWNLSIELLWAHTSDRYIRVRFEDFIQMPEQVIGEIANLAGCDRSRLPDVADSTLELGQSHTAAGNPDRFTTGTVELRRRSNRRRSELSTAEVWLVRIVCWPLSQRYGY